MNKKIVYLTKHTPAGPSSRYRSFQYRQIFEENGYSVTYRPLFPSSYINSLYQKDKKPLHIVFFSFVRRFFQVLFLKHYDIVFIEYELFPFIPFLLERLLLSNKKNIILDYDDAVFHNYDRSQNILIRRLCGNKISKLARLAKHVITGSPYLTGVLSTYTSRVTEIPTCVSFHKYQNVPPAFTSPENAAFRIGWIGSKTTGKNILLLRECLAALQQQYNVELALIGFDIFLETELNGINHVLYKWEEATEVSLIKTFDVGIMPLTDDPFNNGKCGFKLIQYMACGLPTISTPLAANKKINRNGKNLHASTQDEWLQSFREIIQKKQYYKEEVGVQNQCIVKQFYSVESNYQTYLRLFDDMLSNTS